MADATLRVRADTREAERGLGRLQSSLKALATGAVVAGFIKLADQATELRNRLNQVSTSTEQSALLFDRLVTVANNARSPLSTTGDLFFRISKNIDTLGISQNQALLATELVAKAISASGISAAQASGPLLQLGQALSSGTLQGDELKSILEGLPPVAKAIADSLGVPIGRLRELGSQGKISSQQVIQGILAARDSIERDFGKTTATFGQQFTVLTNNFTVFIDKLNTATGATSTFGKAVKYLSDFIVFLGDNIGIITTLFEILFVVLVTRGIGAAGKAILEFSRSIRSIGYFFANTAKSAANFIGTVVSGFRMLITEVGGTGAVKIAGPLDKAMRALVLPIGYLIKIGGQFFKQFAIPIGVGLAYLGDLLDPLIERFANLGRTIVSAFKQGSFAARKMQGADADAQPGGFYGGGKPPSGAAALLEEQMNKQSKRIAEATKAQRDFDKEFEKSIRTQEYELMLKQNSNVLSATEIAVLTEINKELQKALGQEARLTEQQALRIRNVIEETAALERMAQSRREIEEAGRSVIQAAGAADPRVAAETEYINQKIALENYFVQNSLMTQEQYLSTLFQIEEQYRIAKYDASVALEERINSIRQRGIEQELRRNGFSLEQARKISTERVEFENKGSFERTQFAIDQAGQLFTALGQYNRKAFMAAKAFNIANAIMNTYMAATKALATYPPPFSFIAAGAAIAMGLAQVAQISSQNYSGRAIGGPVMGNKPYLVGERGPELMVPQGAGRVVPNTQLGTGEPVVINLNIQAVDARGVDQLIMERKGMIVGMVRSAINDRGARAPL